MIDIKKFFSRNLLLKVFSLLFAFLLWLVIVNQQDPVTTETINNIPVTIKNSDYFSSRDQYVQLESDLKVNVTVSGRRSIVEKLNASDFQAYIDYMAVKAEEGKAEIQCSVQKTVTIKSMSTSYIKLAVEDIVTKEVPVQVRTEGTAAEGYMTVENDPYLVQFPSQVQLKGPQSQVDRITGAYVTVDVEQATENVSGKGKRIEFLDKEGQEISLDELPEVDYSFKLMSELVVPVYKIQSKPFAEVEVIEDAASGLSVEKSELSADSVLLYGPEEVLNKITSIRLNSVMTKGHTESFEVQYDLETICAQLSQQYGVHIGLADPDGVKSVTLKVTLKEKETREYTLSDSNFSLRNLADGKSGTIINPPKAIKILGDGQDLDNLTSANIKVILEVGEFTQDGTYEAKVQYELPKGMQAVDAPQTLQVVIAAQTQDDQSP